MNLPYAQQLLLKAVTALGRPLVVVFMAGGALSESADGAAALIHAFYPGELGGEALAQLIFGEARFSGRMPVTTPVAS